jgi:hypothetical protein
MLVSYDHPKLHPGNRTTELAAYINFYGSLSFDSLFILAHMCATRTTGALTNNR